MIKEDIGGDLTDIPNEKYKKFFDKFKEIETLDITQWRAAHVLAYFCKKYKEQYNVKYQFKFNSPSPTKCFEIFQIKRLSNMLTANPSLLKEYIDWVYATKVVQAKRRLTSISFMTNEGLMNEYKFNVLLADKSINIDRSTLLPEKYQTVFQEAGMSIKTYGELAFISHMSDMSDELIAAFDNVAKMGLDKESLKKII